MIDAIGVRFSRSLLALFLSLTPLLLRAEIDQNEVLQAAAAITAASEPNADMVLLDRHVRVRYNPDGTYSQRDESYSKILTEKGRRQWQTVASYFTLPYNTTEFEVVRIIRADGGIEVLDHASQSRVMTDRSQMDSNIFNPNRRILQVSVPDLQINDIVHFVLHDEFSKTRVPDTFSDYLVFAGPHPIRRMVYEIDAPQQLPLQRIVTKDEIAGTLTFTQHELAERIVYRWEARAVPQVFPEPHMPSMHTVVQRTLVSTIPDWQSLSRWYWNLSLPRLEATTPEMQRTVERLTAGLSSERQQIEAIFYYVSQQIRYMGITIEDEAPGYEPHDVSLTFERKHGVCRDKAALLVAMLRMQGFAAFPVIIHNGPKKEIEVPQPFFNHAVVAVDLGERDYLLMDPTDENTRELFPSYLNNQSFVVARPEGETLLTSAISPAEENLVTIHSHGRVDADGSLHMRSQIDFAGINDNVYRGHFSRLKPEERQQFFAGLVKRIVPGAQLTQLTIRPRNILDTSEQLHVELAYSASDIVIRDPQHSDTLALLPLPRAGTNVGWVNFLLGRLGLETRQFPLRTETACGVVETLELELAAELGNIQKLPIAEPIQSETLSWAASVDRSEHGLRAESKFVITAVEVSPTQYLQLKDDLKTIEYQARKMPLLANVNSYEAVAVAAAVAVPLAADEELGEDEPDVLIIDKTVDTVVADASSWTTTTSVRKQILTYAGMKANSDLRINFNPDWEEVVVHIARVIAPDGSVSTIKAKEMNLMDQGWTGGAPRYPAGKTLVVSLPGVEVGSVIEHTIEHRYWHRPFFDLGEVFRYSDPLQSKTLRVQLPAELAVQVVAAAEVTAETSHDQTHQQYVFHSGAQAAVKPERDLPPWWSFNPTVVLSSGNWSDYAQLLGTTLLEATSDSEPIRKLAAQLTMDIDDADAKLAALRNFVARNIRRVGPGLAELPLSAVSTAERTLRDGYGNSTDHAVVLYSLLAAAGFEPQFLGVINAPLAPELQRQRLEMARLSLINNVLVRVRSNDAWIYLNDTDQYAVLGSTASAQHAALLLPHAEFIKIQPPAGKRNRIDTHYDVALKPNGNARITRTRQYYGNDYNAFHKQFAEMPPEQRHRHHQELVASISQSASAVSEFSTDYSVYPAVETFAVEVERYAVRDDATYYFQLPSSLRGLLQLRGDKRENPLYQATPRQQRLSVAVTLPDAFPQVNLAPVRGSDSIVWELPDNGGRVGISSCSAEAAGADASKLEIIYDVDLQPSVIGAANYDQLLLLQQRLDHPRARTILLRSAFR